MRRTKGHLVAGVRGSVAKRLDGRYLGRHRTWVKIKRRFELDRTVLAVRWGRDGELRVLCAAANGQELGWAEAPSARLRAAAAAGRVMPGSLVTIAFSNWTARGRLREARVVASRSL